MAEDNEALKTLIDASIKASKPDHSAVTASQIDQLLVLGGMPELRTIAGSISGGGEKAGASSGIVLFDAEGECGARSLVLRYAPSANPLRIFKSYDIAAQFALQQILHHEGLPVPRPLCVDKTGEALGCPGYAMEQVTGTVADGSPFTGGIIAEASEQERKRLIDTIFKAMGQVHALDWRKAGLAPFVRGGDNPRPIEGYIGWFWQTALWSSPVDLERLDRARQRLIDNQPQCHPDDIALVHGDPGLGNYMFAADGSMAAILDWELAGLMHPTYDVLMQCALNDFFRGSAGPEVAAKIPSGEEWVDRYLAVTGESLTNVDFYSTLVAFCQAVVFLSMNRAVPDCMKDEHRAMLDPVWKKLDT